ncbi:MAG: PorV/PorQ family protein [Candidatus Eisenbacteria bacterium]
MIRASGLKLRLSTIITAGLLILPILSTAAKSAGNSAGITMTFPTGARSLAMGDACCGLSGSPDAVNYNPAALSELRSTEISAFYERRLVDDSFSGIRLAWPAPFGVLGLSLLHYTSGDIELVTTAGDVRVVVGQQDYIAAFRYAARPWQHLGIGVGFKVMKSTLAEEFHASGVSSDFGWLYESGDRGFSLGGSVTNFGEHLEYKKQTEDIPWIVRLGGAYACEVVGSSLRVSGDLVRVRESDLREHIGIESLIVGCLAVRAGYKFGYENAGLTFGFGLQVGRLQLDHGIGVTDHFGDIHLTQITYVFF